MFPTCSQRPLVELAPSLPWIQLATLPTELRDVRLPDGATVAVKDDGAAGDRYGGNKVRKLEFLFADALQEGFGRVWTIGAIGSNHVTATSALARPLGLSVEALHFPQPVTPHVVRNLAAVASQGTRLRLAPSLHALPFWLAAANVRRAVRSKTGRVYAIPGGGSSPVGCLGYVNAALELVAQYRELGRELPERIYVAAGTAGTLVGIIVGLALAGVRDVDVHGVRVTDAVVCNRRIVGSLISDVCAVLARHGVRVPGTVGPWRLRDDQFGPGYGVPTDGGAAAIKAASDGGGLYLEPTYTAKTFAALLSDQANDSLPGRALYWHTLNSRDVLRLVDPHFDIARLPSGYARFFRDPGAAGWDEAREHTC